MGYHLEGRLLEVCNCRVLVPVLDRRGSRFRHLRHDRRLAFRQGHGRRRRRLRPDDRDDRARSRQHPAGQLDAPPSISTNACRPRRRRRCSASTPARRAGRSRELAKLVGEVVSVREGADHVHRAGRPAGRSSSATPATPSSSRTRARPAQTTTLTDTVFSTVPGAPVFVGKAHELQVEEREARHRPRHQGPQRAAEHVRVRRASRAAPRAGAPRSRPRPGRGTDDVRRPCAPLRRGSRATGASRALFSARCWSLLVGRAWAALVCGARAPTGATSTTAAGATGRARRAVPGGAAGRHRGAGRAARARVGADDRGDDAADDLSAAGDVPRASPARGPTPDGSRRSSWPASSPRGSPSASRRTSPTRAVRWRRRRSRGSSVNGWVVGAAVLAGAGLFQFSALKYRCLEQCRTPFAFVASRWHGRAPLARGVAASASTTASSASAAAGR